MGALQAFIFPNSIADRSKIMNSVPSPENDQQEPDSHTDQEGLNENQAEILLELQRDIMESIVLGSPAQYLFENICLLIERIVPGSVVTIMLMHEESYRLFIVAAPTLSDSQVGRFTGIKPGPESGSCGNAIYSATPQYVSDIVNDTRWNGLRDLANELNLGACWSQPITTTDTRIAGSLAITSFRKRTPSYFHRRLLETSAHLAGIILQRDKIEKTLEQTESKLRGITNTLPGVVFQLRLFFTAGRYQLDYVSDGIKSLLNYPVNATPKLNALQRHIHRDDQNQIQQSLLTASESLSPWQHDFRIITTDNSQRWVQARAIPEPPRGDGSIIWNGVLLDITNSKATELKLRQSAIAFENTSEGIMITDPQSRIIDINSSFCRITGFTRDEVLGQTPRLFHSGKHDSAFYQTLWAHLESKGYWQGEIWNRRKSGEIFPEWISISVVKNERQETTHYVAVFADISQMKESEKKLIHLAHHDTLTGLPNRLLFNARLEHAMERADRNKKRIGLLFLDLDRFKNINDSLGHAIGDDLLKQVASRIKDTIRSDDTVARLGGDEFTIIMEDLNSNSDAVSTASKLLNSFHRPFELHGHEFHITTSIGLSQYPDDGSDPESLLKNADTAMYRAKENGRNTLSLYTPQMSEEVRNRTLLEKDLWKALRSDELEVWYQPQYCLKEQRYRGVEALVRWRHPIRGMIQTDYFIGIAEDADLIGELGEWVTRQACQDIALLAKKGFALDLSVNLSSKQLNAPGCQRLIHIARQSDIQLERLEFEISENFIMHDPDRTLPVLNLFGQHNISLAIDDFGSGYSSLAYLSHLPLNRIKIDRSLIQEVSSDLNDAAIVQAIIALAHTLELTVTAEGVETARQYEFLEASGIDLIQGFILSPPLTCDLLLELLQQQASV
ncbi:MAG: hypothetical protein C0631_16095 [Sedimenticola sp.]|nr:MAG: hypothetical protein C0631_16095 [Sedimenticola sp.]